MKYEFYVLIVIFGQPEPARVSPARYIPNGICTNPRHSNYSHAGPCFQCVVFLWWETASKNSYHDISWSNKNAICWKRSFQGHCLYVQMHESSSLLLKTECFHYNRSSMLFKSSIILLILPSHWLLKLFEHSFVPRTRTPARALQKAILRENRRLKCEKIC